VNTAKDEHSYRAAKVDPAKTFTAEDYYREAQTCLVDALSNLVSSYPAKYLGLLTSSYASWTGGCCGTVVALMLALYGRFFLAPESPDPSVMVAFFGFPKGLVVLDICLINVIIKLIDWLK